MNESYLAGLIDGEGYIGITKHLTEMRKIALDPQISISLVEGEVLEMVQVFLGFGKVRFRKEKRKNHRDIHEFYCKSQAECLMLIEKILPYLIVKSQRATILKLFLISRINRKGGKNNAKPYSEKELEYYEMLKKLNRRGRNDG